ncbi:DUF2460 domain-containing protein [Pararhizobium mangrovi]|uniref:TIGR02217 family protein n=1 Tax=Pararhizobium mangrovi TaxID=2590452 RepID=A0A506UHH6_9HYPH|nr:DUF2460 domain-containing protein [Pararhizobium mangrovi]TPW32763.1 TIGR02217 family protein [Pararhizobium mangrovi]
MASDFHEVRFPLRVALGTSGGPRRRTDIVDLSNGRESRNARWRASRRHYDAGSGIKALADLYAVLAFFEARRGQLYGFRFHDPIDNASCAPGREPAAGDQHLGIADGTRALFPLVKRYGDAGGAFERTIAKPCAGSVKLAVNGEPVSDDDFTLDTVEGTVRFAAGAEPAAGGAVTAGFRFDVPVRFDVDRIDIDLSGFEAGRIPAIPLVEILP